MFQQDARMCDSFRQGLKIALFDFYHFTGVFNAIETCAAAEFVFVLHKFTVDIDIAVQFTAFSLV